MFYLQTSVLLLLISVTNLRKIDCQLDISAFPLSGKSFKITSKIYSTRSDADSFLTEHYSIDQRRGNLVYKRTHRLFTNLDADNQYTYDSIINAGIKFDKQKGVCKEYSHEEMLATILDDQAPTAELMNLAGSDQDLGYVIGPARLLFLIASRADKLELRASSLGSEKFVRNIPVVMYQLDLQLSGVISRLFISYNKQTYFPDSPRSSIPLQIVIDNLTFGSLRIDYHDHQIISSSKVHSDYRSDAKLAARNSPDQTMDMFAFPTSLNCDKFLGDNNHANLFEQYDLMTTRFSFTTSDLFLLEPPSNHFVAFDGMTHSMRIDHERVSFSQANIKATVNLLDFRTNRRYIMQDNEADRQRLLKTLGTSGSQCVVTNILGPDKKEYQQRSLKLSNFLLGASKFAYMGRAQVRGRHVRVYEANSTTWPYWLSRPLAFRDDKGNYERRETHQPVQQNRVKSSRETYSIVVYLLDPSSEDALMEGLKILQLEVYDLTVAPRSTHRMLVRVQFHDLIWDLRESPNGDKGYQLFSHIDLCSAEEESTNGGNRYAEVDLLLEEDEKIESKDVDWIESWRLRNDALGSSLRDVLNVQTMMIYDLESKFIKHDRGDKGVRRYIETSFRIAEHPRWIYKVSFVGNAFLKDTKSTFIINEVQSPSECLWLVGGSFESLYIYYSETSGSCIVDLDLAKGDNDEAGLEKSGTFKLHPEQLGELYKVERQFDDEIRIANTWLRDGRTTYLENRMMYLQRILPDDFTHPVDPNELAVRIRKVKIKNVNYMSGLSSDNKQIEPPASVFAGFGLVLTEESKRFVRRAANKRTDENSRLATILTREQCQTECLADLNCRAYSYCIRGADEECLLSGLGFHEPGVREHLESRDVQRSRQNSIVRLTIDAFNMQLVRDFRCELHNKIHMELFKRSWPSITTLRGLQVFQVSNEEQCARLCFSQSLVSILASVSLGTEIKKSLSTISDAQSISIDKLEDLRRRHRHEMTQFCQYFMYLDSSISEQQEALLKRHTSNKDDPQSSASSWFCIMDGNMPDYEEETDSELESTYFRLTTFKFDFAKLFEKRYDFGLKESEFSQEEHDAFLSHRRGEAMELSQYELLKKTVVEGKNYQLELNVDENTCAQQCFMQHSGLWPACRSFDMTQVARYWRETVDFICVLNTASYSSEKVVNEVRETKKSNVQLWHYEPRFWLAQEELDNAYLLDEVIDDPLVIELIRQATIGWMGAILIALVGIVSGLLLGLLVSRRLVAPSKQETNIAVPVILTPYQRHQGDEDL